MYLFKLEHSRFAYALDFVIHSLIIFGMLSTLIYLAPATQCLSLATTIAFGYATWTLIEYLLHRFVLHGLKPFCTWHAAHHERPRALICTPTLLTVSSLLIFVLWPTYFLSNWLVALAFTIGVWSGYLAYAIAHHATHHWLAQHSFSKKRKHWHALHHQSLYPSHFGVTSRFWDKLFGSL